MTTDKPTKPGANKRRLRKTVYWIVGGLLLGAALWIMFSPDPVAVEVTTVRQGPMQVTVNNQGLVRVQDRYVVTAPVAAGLQRIALDAGAPVRKDQVLAVLDPLPLDARQRQEANARLEAARALAREAALRVERAAADMRLAASERTRIQSLVKDNFVSPQALEKAIAAEATARAEWAAARSRQQAAQADVKAAEAAVSVADAPLGTDQRPIRQIRLRSPVDGFVLNVAEKSARTVTPGAPLLTVADPSRYEVVVDVLSTDAVKIKPGAPMLLGGWGGGETLRAQVRRVEPVAFTKVSALGVEEQRVNVIGDPVDALGPLGDGYRVEARIVIWETGNATKVAGSSLFRVGETWRVFVVEEGIAREREVKIGQRNQEEAEILNGLQPGATVVRFPNNELQDGTRVEVRQ